MSGTPFKMKGHSLPGPNQASPAKQTGDLEYGQYGMPRLRGTKPGRKKEQKTPTPELTQERIAWESGKRPGLQRTGKTKKKKNIVTSFTDFLKSKK